MILKCLDETCKVFNLLAVVMMDKKHVMIYKDAPHLGYYGSQLNITEI